MIEKVGVYCRLSNEDKDKKNKDDDSDSIQNQKSMLLKYAISNDWEVIDIYSDDDYSGAGVYRPDFERLISDCEAGRINLVLCKNQSRFSRDMEVIEKYLHNKFIEWGVRFISIVDNADTSVKGNKKTRQINGLTNEWYLEDLSEEIKKVLRNKRKDGLFIGSFAPYGYMKNPENKHELVIDEIAASVVRKIFELYKSGLGYYRIAKLLNEEKILTPSLYKKENGSKFVCCNLDYSKSEWSVDTVYKILRNQTYIGTLIQGKRTTISHKNHKTKLVDKEKWSVKENTHEPIINNDTWVAVQQRLRKNESPTRTGEIHFFSQKIYCEECKSVFSRNVYRVKGGPNGKRAYMQCKGAKKYRRCNNRSSIRIDVLENAIINEINLQIKKYYKKDSLENQYQSYIKTNNKYPDRVGALEVEKQKNIQKITEQNNYYRNLYEDKIKQIISESEFVTLRELYIKELSDNKMRIEKIEEELKLLNTKNEKKDNITSLFNKYKKINSLNKIIVDEFIDKIYIGKLNKETKEKDIIIEWNIGELI